MCGLFGFWGSSPFPRKIIGSLESVACSQAQRGRDAFGISWRGADDTVEAFKRRGSVTDHRDELMRALDATTLIGHTRMTTHGSADDNINNHPHLLRIDDQPSWIVHNGIIPNYLEIANSNGLELKGSCDSEVIARFLEDSNGPILDRVRAFVSLVDPTAPFAMAALLPQGLVLARRGNPLYWSETSRRNWFASTSHALPGIIHELPDEIAALIPFGDEEVSQVQLRARVTSTRLWQGSDHFCYGRR
jgi:glutamine---fructose-6-phosphate transaminase (isomerizing)